MFRQILIKTVVLLMLLGGITSSRTFAQTSSDPQQKAEFSIEVDPFTFAFKGYGAHFRFKPKRTDHFLIGVGAYAMDMPQPLVNLNKENRDKGWDLRLNQGVGLFGEYHFKTVNRGWFGGVQMGVQEYKIEQEALQGSEKYTNFLGMAFGGYTFQPFDFPLYFKPWGGVGYTSKIGGSNVLGDQEFDIAPVTMFGTLHVGYTF